MDKEKLKKLMQDEEFINKIAPLETKEEIQKAFKSKGLEISMEELEEFESIGKKALDDSELGNVSGGKFSAEKAHEASLNAMISTGVGFAGGILLPTYSINDGIIKTFNASNQNDLGKGIGYTACSVLVLGGIIYAGVAVGKRLARNSKDKCISSEEE